MPNMPRKTKMLGFKIKEVLPPDDGLAMFLLVMMATYNDLVYLTQWSDMEWTESDHAGQRRIDAGEEFFQARLACSFFHEFFEAFDRLLASRAFKSFRSRLSQKGQQALDELNRMKKRSDIRNLLKQTRNQATFHYQEEEFKAALMQILPHYDSAQIVRIQYNDEQQFSYYYPLADNIRLRIALGMSPTDEPKPKLDRVVKLVKDLLGSFAIFLDEFHRAYVGNRNPYTEVK